MFRLFLLYNCAYLFNCCYYVGVVYEHQVTSDLQKSSPKEIIQGNLNVYKNQIKRASKEEANIIVFPEYGLTGFHENRTVMAQFLEEIPNIGKNKINPCETNSGSFSILNTLSCWAKKYKIYIVANLGEVSKNEKNVNMSKTKIQVPPIYVNICSYPDENKLKGYNELQKQYNTDVVFDKYGNLIAKYRKCHLCGEPNFDTPNECELVTFDTDFAGKFGIFTCFDINFMTPAVDLITKHGVRNIVFPTSWPDLVPYITAVAVQLSYAIRMNVNLLAANTKAIKRWGEHGSGIYIGHSGADNYVNDYGNKDGGHFIIATLQCVPYNISKNNNVTLKKQVLNANQKLSGITAAIDPFQIDRDAQKNRSGKLEELAEEEKSKKDFKRSLAQSRNEGETNLLDLEKRLPPLIEINDIYFEAGHNQNFSYLDHGRLDFQGRFDIPKSIYHEGGNSNPHDYLLDEKEPMFYRKLSSFRDGEPEYPTYKNFNILWEEENVNYKVIEAPTKVYDYNVTRFENICHGDLCCHLTYRFVKSTKQEQEEGVMILAVYDGKHVDMVDWYLKICAFNQCPTSDVKSCGTYGRSATHSFAYFKLTGNFSGVNSHERRDVLDLNEVSKLNSPVNNEEDYQIYEEQPSHSTHEDSTYVFPFVLADGADLACKCEWYFVDNKTIVTNSVHGFREKILTVALWGRSYNLDNQHF